MFVVTMDDWSVAGDCHSSEGIRDVCVAGAINNFTGQLQAYAKNHLQTESTIRSSPLASSPKHLRIIVALFRESQTPGRSSFMCIINHCFPLFWLPREFLAVWKLLMEVCNGVGFGWVQTTWPKHSFFFPTSSVTFIRYPDRLSNRFQTLIR